MVSSASLIDHKIDALDALTAAVVFQNRFRLPVPRVDDVCNPLRVFEPPTVPFVTGEVQADVALRDS